MIIILLLLLIILGTSFGVYIAAFYNPNNKDVTYKVLEGEDYDVFHDEMIGLIDEAVVIPFEEVYTLSHDGKKLYGRLYLRNPDAPLHIEFNGYKGNGIRDFSGGLQLALGRNENVLLVDQRSHGKSEGHTISFGVKERFDVLKWIEYALERFGKNTVIYLEGVSMGAATVLMASELSLPENVKAIMADCPYSSPYAIIKKVAAETVRFSGILLPFIYLGGRIFGGFSVFASSAENAVKNTKVPILIIHGTGDHFVPVEMSRRIKESNPGMITFVEIEGAPHGLSYIKDYLRYKETYNSFMDSVK